MIEGKDSLWEQSDDEEQGSASAGGGECDVEGFFERGSDSSVDEEEPVDNEEEFDQNDNQILSPGGIS